MSNKYWCIYNLKNFYFKITFGNVFEIAYFILLFGMILAIG